jgi:F-type H+-transporting ATPase subunit gamma
MAKTQDIRRRIRSVRNTMQLTKAMKMVAASKLRRSQERMLKARPFAHATLRVLRSLAARADADLHPLLQSHGRSRLELVVMTGDKGLCGAFNAAILRLAESFAHEEFHERIGITAVGKKARDYFRQRNYELSREYVDVFRQIDFETAKSIADELTRRYVEREIDVVYLVYNEFKSAIQAKPTVQRLLPIEPTALEGDVPAGDYLYEPSPEQIFGAILPAYVRVLVFHAMLESAAAEHAARMAAMEAATNNAMELIDSLTLTLNRVRQASITTEIIEVVSGAEALG